MATDPLDRPPRAAPVAAAPGATVPAATAAAAARSRALYEAHADHVTNILASYGVPSDDQPDLRQKVFLAAHRKIDSLAPESTPEGEREWLASICLNEVHTERRHFSRRLAREVLCDDLDPPEEESPAYVAGVARRRATAELHALLACLPPDQAVAFYAFEILGETAAVIAARLGIPEATVHSRVRLARKRLADLAARVQTARSRRSR